MGGDLRKRLLATEDGPKALPVVEKVFRRINWGPAERAPMWTGRVLNAERVLQSEQWDEDLNLDLLASNLLHEVGHYLCAKPPFRYRVEYGLGGFLDDMSERYEELAYRAHRARDASSDRSTYEEEQEASLLGILIEYEIGMPWQYTAERLSWADDAEDLIGEIEDPANLFTDPKRAAGLRVDSFALVETMGRLIESGLADDSGHLSPRIRKRLGL